MVLTPLNFPPEVVASHADAWIEIVRQLKVGELYLVASHADAWIEIQTDPSACLIISSHPTRMRGLK